MVCYAGESSEWECSVFLRPIEQRNLAKRGMPKAEVRAGGSNLELSAADLAVAGPEVYGRRWLREDARTR